MTACPWASENAAGRCALTQAIGYAAAEAGFEALLAHPAVSVAAASDLNLAVFVDRLQPSRSVLVIE